MENIKYLMALKAVKGLGDGLINLLLSHFKDPRMIFEASGDQLSKVVGVGNKIITSVQNFDEWDLINTELENVGKNNYSIVTIYSEHLKLIPSFQLVKYQYHINNYIIRNSIRHIQVKSNSMVR